MTPADRSQNAAYFRQAQIHQGLGRDSTPSRVALAALRRTAQDVQACLAQDPSIALTLPVPHGLLGMLAEMIAQTSEPSAKEP